MLSDNESQTISHINQDANPVDSARCLLAVRIIEKKSIASTTAQLSTITQSQSVPIIHQPTSKKLAFDHVYRTIHTRIYRYSTVYSVNRA